MQTYNEELKSAIEFSKELGIYDGDFVLNSDKKYVAEWLMYDLGAKIAEFFTKDSYTKFLADLHGSIRLHHKYKPILDKLLDIDCLITTGYVQVPNDAHELEDFGKFTQADTALALKAEKIPQKIHTWFTLPSGEVIDMGFMTMYGVLYQEESLIGNIVAKDPKDFTGGMEYHPRFVGEAFYEKCNFDFRIDFAKYEAAEEA